MSENSPPPAASSAAAAGKVPPPGPPPQIIIQQRDGSVTLYRVLALIGWIGFVVCGLWALAQLVALAGYFDTTEGLTEKYHSGGKFAADKIAILNVSGVIMEGSGFVKKQIDRIKQDAQVKAVVVRINSPGGTITGSDYILHHLNKLREEKGVPLVVSMGSVAASGGYYVAMAVGDQKDAIFAEPTTTTGSIGVLVPHYDISGLMERWDVKDDTISSHPRKQMLSITRPMSDDDRRIVEAYVDEAFERFKTIIQSGRPEFRQDAAALDALATGQIFTAQQAIENGLVDQVGFIEEAIDRAAELAGLDANAARVVEFEAPVSLMNVFGLSQARPRQQHPLAALFEWSVPRAYYLYSS